MLETREGPLPLLEGAGRFGLPLKFPVFPVLPTRVFSETGN